MVIHFCNTLFGQSICRCSTLVFSCDPMWSYVNTWRHVFSTCEIICFFSVRVQTISNISTNYLLTITLAITVTLASSSLSTYSLLIVWQSVEHIQMEYLDYANKVWPRFPLKWAKIAFKQKTISQTRILLGLSGSGLTGKWKLKTSCYWQSGLELASFYTKMLQDFDLSLFEPYKKMSNPKPIFLVPRLPPSTPPTPSCWQYHSFNSEVLGLFPTPSQAFSSQEFCTLIFVWFLVIHLYMNQLAYSAVFACYSKPIALSHILTYPATPLPSR